MAGHVFITRADITRLACDHWLLPTDSRMGAGVRRLWFPHISEEVKAAIRAVQPDSSRPSPQVAEVLTQSQFMSRPRPWLVQIGTTRVENAIDWFVKGAIAFLNAVTDSMPSTPVHGIHGRSVPLVALPVVGGGHGGGARRIGEIITRLLKELYSRAPAARFDVVLVTNNDVAFAAAQAARRKLWRNEYNGSAATQWQDIDAPLRQKARSLSRKALRGELVLFVGAGVSQGAGLPNWDCLLTRLAKQAGINDTELPGFNKLNHLDKARFIEMRLSSEQVQIGDVIARMVRADCYSLTHSLLAALPVNEVATTNYDELFEFASEDAGRPAAVLPYNPRQNQGRWLLKMHGCVNHPDDIVLTRDHFLEYSERRAALAGIVQALLITRHMLFVGFSLTDDNFHRIALDVRKAIRPQDAPVPSHSRFGTAVKLVENPALDELWRNDIEGINMSPASDTDTAAAARRQEIILDYLLFNATDNFVHLLRPEFDAVLNDDERLLRDAITDFRQRIPSRARAIYGWRRIERLLQEFGDTTT